MSSEDRGYVLVGCDRSPGSEQALRWAIREAVMRYLPLRIVHAYDWPFTGQPPSQAVFDAMGKAAQAVLDTGTLIARGLAPRLVIESRLCRGTATGALLGHSSSADVLVVGGRGAGGFDRLSVGSVPIQVSAHADCPTIVVRRTGGEQSRGLPASVVVGVNGSAASEAALAFAFEEAALRRGSLRVLCSWWEPGATAREPRVPYTDPRELEKQAAARFQRGSRLGWRSIGRSRSRPCSRSNRPALP